MAENEERQGLEGEGKEKKGKRWASVVVGVMKGDVKEGKNKFRLLRVGAALSRRLSRRPLPARERVVFWRKGCKRFLM